MTDAGERARDSVGDEGGVPSSATSVSSQLGVLAVATSVTARLCHAARRYTRCGVGRADLTGSGVCRKARGPAIVYTKTCVAVTYATTPIGVTAPGRSSSMVIPPNMGGIYA